MAEMKANVSERQLNVRHRGRIEQIGIYFGKFLRMFVYQSDWKVLPMAALIAGLVGFVMAADFGVSMEGTITGCFAMICVCIWNGCFNSIQVVCRERNVVKREHRSGMHITSYVFAHMMYQLILCVLQTVVTVAVSSLVGMKYSGPGIVTPWLVLDIGLTMFFVTYAADMMALWISTLCKSTTTAMTIMPFVLIFQLVFSGGVIPLPSYVDPIMQLTISCPGIKAMSSQIQVNSMPYATIDTMIDMMGSMEIDATITFGDVLDLLGDKDNKTIREIRDLPIRLKATAGDALREIGTSKDFESLREKVLIEKLSVGDVLELLLMDSVFMDAADKLVLDAETTFGEVVDFLAANETIQRYRGESLSIHTTVNEILDVVGKEEVMKMIEKKASEANFNPAYIATPANVWKNWIHIFIFVAVFAAASIITLEFIDKDKR